MAAATDQALQELLDRASISDVTMLYTRGIDTRDLDLVASCFTQDAQADFYGDKFVGTEAIVNVMRGMERLDPHGSLRPARVARVFGLPNADDAILVA